MKLLQRQRRTLTAFAGVALATARGKQINSVGSLTHIASMPSSETVHSEMFDVSALPASNNVVSDSDTTMQQDDTKGGIAARVRQKAQSIARKFRLRRKKEPEEEEEDEEEEESDTPEGLLEFADVLLAVDLDGLEEFALRIRLSLSASPTWRLGDLDTAHDLTCTIDRDTLPFYGTFNLVWFLRFSDGVKWVARIPGHGLRFGEDDVEKMNSEYYTMRYISANTSIPIPEVYYWTTNCDRVGAPVAFMSFIEGRNLNTVWTPDGFTREQRLTILSDIAESMAQLYDLSFEKAGTLRFDAEGSVVGVGRIIYLDTDIMSDATWERTASEGPHESHREMLSGMNADEELQHSSVRARCHLLNLILDSAPSYLIDVAHYALRPWDFNAQNILVDDAGHVSGFIDWDQVGTEIVANGCGRYPSWIICDCDAGYRYDPDKPASLQIYEESPETLRSYRRHYAEAYARSARKFDGYDPRMTSQSHLVMAMNIAIKNSLSQVAILRMFLRLALGDGSPITLGRYIADFEAGDTSEKDELIRAALPKVWRNEWDSDSDDSPYTERPMMDNHLTKASKIKPDTVERGLEDSASEARCVQNQKLSSQSINSMKDHQSTESQNDSTRFKMTDDLISEDAHKDNVNDDMLFWIDPTTQNADISCMPEPEFRRRSQSPPPKQDPLPQTAQEDQHGTLHPSNTESKNANQTIISSNPNPADDGNEINQPAKFNIPIPASQPADGSEEDAIEEAENTPKQRKSLRKKTKAFLSRALKPLNKRLKKMSRKGKKSQV